MDRRSLLALGASGFVGAVAPFAGLAAAAVSPSLITILERQVRIAKAQGLMRRFGFSTLLIEPGSSLVYLTGIQWSRSERLTCAILPVEGEIGVVMPFFEEPSVRERLAVTAQVRTWQEHEEPLALVAGWLKDRSWPVWFSRPSVSISQPV